VIEDLNGSVFGIYAEGEWKEASPNFDGKKSFYFCLTEKVPRKENLSKKSFNRDVYRSTHDYLLFFGKDFYITNTGVACCNLATHIGYRQLMNIKEFAIYQIEDMASAVNVDPAPTSTSRSRIPDPNPYGMALESDGKLSALANKVTKASLLMAETMADYNKTFLARLRSLSEIVFKAEKELLMEILLVSQLTAPARCEIKAGLKGRWEAIVAKNSAMTSTNCGNSLSVMVKELLYQLYIMGVAAKKSNKEEKVFFLWKVSGRFSPPRVGGRTLKRRRTRTVFPTQVPVKVLLRLLMNPVVVFKPKNQFRVPSNSQRTWRIWTT
jgi:hypothetical protein